MKKLAALLTAVMLLTLLAVPAMATVDSPEVEIPVVTELPDPNDEDAPPIVILDDEVPLSEGETPAEGDAQEGGDTQQAGDVVVQRPQPGTYVRYNDPEEGWTYIPEDEVPMSEAPAAGDSYIHTDLIMPESGVGVVTEITGDVLSSIINGVDVDTEVISIDASSENVQAAYNEVVFRQDAISEIVKTGLPMEVSTDLGVFTFDSLMVQAMDAAGEDVVLVVFQLEESSTSVVREDIGAFVTFELRLLKDGTSVSFNGGSVNVTIPFEYDYEKAYVGYVSGGEVVEEYELNIDKANKTASWDCPHFSTWVIYQNSAVVTPQPEASTFNIWMIISIILFVALIASWIILGKGKKRAAKA